MFEEGEIGYIYMHSHPTNAGASAEDFLALYKLDQSRQTIVEPDGTIQIQKPTEVPENVSREGPVVVETPLPETIDWDAVVPENGPYAGENRVDHIRRHNVNDLSKPNHGVFNGDGVDMTNKAWEIAKQQNLTPNAQGILIVPYENAGYKGGSMGDGSHLNSIKIIVIPGTNKIITAYPF